MKNIMFFNVIFFPIILLFSFLIFCPQNFVAIIIFWIGETVLFLLLSIIFYLLFSEKGEEVKN